MSIDSNKSYVGDDQNSKGDIVADLYQKMPADVNNFVFPSRGTGFTTISPSTVSWQDCDPGRRPGWERDRPAGYNIPPEIKSKHTLGALAMARPWRSRADDARSGSQFYITPGASTQPGWRIHGLWTGEQGHGRGSKNRRRRCDSIRHHPGK